MGLRRIARFFAGCAAATLVFGLVGTATPAFADSGRSHNGDQGSDHDHHHGHHRGGALFVSPDGSDSAVGNSCDTANFTSINDAIAAAPDGGTVVVCPGTYPGNVLVNKSLNLLGQDATIDATDMENGIWVVASDVHISGFTLENANGEGLLAGVDILADAGMLPASGPVLKDVTVEDNNVINNNKGFNGTEQGNCKYPGDCGAGIHFNVTTDSTMKGNTVTGNSDGVLLTDDYGPSSHNVIEDNVVNDNLSECGIVLPSHSSDAVTFDPTTFEVTAINPSMGGVYDNVVRDNIADGNGTNPAPPQFGGGGSGSGIGLFASGPGSAVYNNLVIDNEASGNGLAGLAMHAHHPGGENIDGNVIVHNTFGTNNTGGDGFDGPPVTDFQTTGIAIFSVPTAHMVISHNKIHDDEIGIWLSTTVDAQGLKHNHFKNVTTKVVTG